MPDQQTLNVTEYKPVPKANAAAFSDTLPHEAIVNAMPALEEATLPSRINNGAWAMAQLATPEPVMEGDKPKPVPAVVVMKRGEADRVLIGDFANLDEAKTQLEILNKKLAIAKAHFRIITDTRDKDGYVIGYVESEKFFITARSGPFSDSELKVELNIEKTQENGKERYHIVAGAETAAFFGDHVDPVSKKLGKKRFHPLDILDEENWKKAKAAAAAAAAASPPRPIPLPAPPPPEPMASAPANKRETFLLPPASTEVRREVPVINIPTALAVAINTGKGVLATTPPAAKAALVTKEPVPAPVALPVDAAGAKPKPRNPNQPRKASNPTSAPAVMSQATPPSQPEQGGWLQQLLGALLSLLGMNPNHNASAGNTAAPSPSGNNTQDYSNGYASLGTMPASNAHLPTRTTGNVPTPG